MVYRELAGEKLSAANGVTALHIRIVYTTCTADVQFFIFPVRRLPPVAFCLCCLVWHFQLHDGAALFRVPITIRRLGFGEPLALSASHGDGMADFASALVPHYQEWEEEQGAHLIDDVSN